MKRLLFGDYPDLQVRKAWLIALFLSGLLVRLIGLNTSLWLDEIFSLVESYRQPFLTVLTVFPGDTQHPLYSVLGNLMVHAFGDANWAIRLPAVIFGAATIPLLYVFACEVTSRREAFFASSLLAVSYHHVWFSQNARGYTMLAFFTILSTLLLLRGLEHGRLRSFGWYAVVSALGVYTHLTMVFVVVAHFIVAMGRESRKGPDGRRFPNRWYPVSGFALTGVISLLLYAPILSQILDFFLNSNSGMEDVSTAGWAIEETIRELRKVLGWSPVIVAGAGIFALGIWSYLRSDMLATALFVSPAIVTVAGALLARGTMYPRFFFSLVGFGILIGVRGMMEVTAWLVARFCDREDAARRTARAGSMVLSLAVVLSTISLVHNYRYPKQDYQGAAHWIDENSRKGDVIVTLGATVFPYKHYIPRNWVTLEHGEGYRVNSFRDEGKRVWIIYTFPSYVQRSHPGLMSVMLEGCSDRKTFRGTLGNGDILVCRLDPLNADGSRD